MATPEGTSKFGTPGDVNMPSLSRVHDHLLGGGHNLASDHVVADAIRALVPRYGGLVRESRAFVRRAVSHMLAAGIEQFLDLGAGMCSARLVHEVARIERSEARVVYVDCDPTVADGNGAVLQLDRR